MVRVRLNDSIKRKYEMCVLARRFFFAVIAMEPQSKQRDHVRDDDDCDNVATSTHDEELMHSGPERRYADDWMSFVAVMLVACIQFTISPSHRIKYVEFFSTPLNICSARLYCYYSSLKRFLPRERWWERERGRQISSTAQPKPQPTRKMWKNGQPDDYIADENKILKLIFASEKNTYFSCHIKWDAQTTGSTQYQR